MISLKVNDEIISLTEGVDVTSLLNIVQWSPPVPACLAGLVKGAWPSSIPKTDEERCLDGNTKVITSDGICKISDIVVGQQVLSFNHDLCSSEFKPVLAISKKSRMTNGWVKITTKSGKTIIATHNHRIWVESLHCYRLVSELCVGNLLKLYQKN